VAFLRPYGKRAKGKAPFSSRFLPAGQKSGRKREYLWMRKDFILPNEENA
jgi:hypothetical protein